MVCLKSVSKVIFTTRSLNFAPPCPPNLGEVRGLERWDLGGIETAIYTSQTLSQYHEVYHLKQLEIRKNAIRKDKKQ